ncbi:MerR family transcriptional regulator [Marinactinospora thermotolerans]|uniref:Predicted transcriptional regulators n=1 Tax=Marinactinospora thermotolerans DSM 45154 TaxID=1122192 RepID=A0A1T4SEV1_9ACTN|nr:MerR family transcriptional regulator [Marinactinospora thermotolerans]SKA26850.1 Predicted transcriptional regulators [Marinactinospora thermotolerans DSM 45154]
MRISELSRASGVPVATIKYYLREGLLPRGETTSATQAVYSSAHLRRLRLIRALAEVGDVPLARIRGVLDAVDDEQIGPHLLLGTALYQLDSDAPAEEDDSADQARQTAERLLSGLGWRTYSGSPARGRLVRALATLDRLGLTIPPEVLSRYAELAHEAAERDLELLDAAAPREEIVERAIAITVLMEQTFTALHRMAQEDISAGRFGTGAPGC